jgi:hypothetical protein
MINHFIYSDGTHMWRQNNKIHRIDGPAVIRLDGSQEYYEYDKLHRIGGPAFIGYDGTKEYSINGKLVTELEHDLLYGIMKLKGLI